MFWIIVLVALADASRGFATGMLLCFGIVVLIVGRFSMRVADPRPQLWGKGFKGMVV